MEKTAEFLKAAGIYYLATEENGQPRVRPFGTAAIFDGNLYIQTGRKKDVYRQIKQNPKVELCAFLKGEWIRVCAEAVEDDRIEAESAVLAQYPSLRHMYAPGDGNNVVFALKNATAIISSFEKAPEVHRFG